MESRLYTEYKNRISKELMIELKLDNFMQVPVLKKITVNSGVGEAVTNGQAIKEVEEVLATITGQKPVINKARVAVSSFKLRPGMEIGVSVTLRGKRMWDFFDKLINVVLPRTKDFRGLPTKSFDGNGNYSFGIKEHTIFPEIDTNKVQKIRGLQVVMNFRSPKDEYTKLFLDKFGFPFAKNVN
ncbi:MAG TPA: 50S ribosomal protein L5 [Candidatus Dojkabacteria bacterium]|nr:50S ribosomal protein L5 [Candidatus Dojkabacteria bacterium]